MLKIFMIHFKRHSYLVYFQQLEQDFPLLHQTKRQAIQHLTKFFFFFVSKLPPALVNLACYKIISKSKNITKPVFYVQKLL